LSSDHWTWINLVHHFRIDLIRHFRIYFQNSSKCKTFGTCLMFCLRQNNSVLTFISTTYIFESCCFAYKKLYQKQF
jgi:hypothetical protein